MTDTACLILTSDSVATLYWAASMLGLVLGSVMGLIWRRYDT